MGEKVNGEDCITKSFKFGNPKKVEKGVVWSACGGEKISYSNLMEEPEGQREHFRDLDWMLKEWDGRR